MWVDYWMEDVNVLMSKPQTASTERLQQYYLSSILSIDVSDALAMPVPYDRTKCLISTCKGPRWRVIVYSYRGGQRRCRNIQTVRFVSITRNDLTFPYRCRLVTRFYRRKIISIFVFWNAHVHVSKRPQQNVYRQWFAATRTSVFSKKKKKKVCKSKE